MKTEIFRRLGSMKTKEMVYSTAIQHFSGGYNCAQSVLLALSDHWRIESEVIPKIATGFGAGIGRCGSVCGALIGGVMAISLRHGANEPSLEKRKEATELAKALYKQFEAEHGSVLCRELIGLNLSKPDDLEKARKERVFDRMCPDYLRTVIEAVLAIV